MAHHPLFFLLATKRAAPLKKIDEAICDTTDQHNLILRQKIRVFELEVNGSSHNSVNSLSKFLEYFSSQRKQLKQYDLFSSL